MANKRLQATLTIGGAVASSLRSAFGTVKAEVGNVGAALRKLEGQQRTANQAIQTFGSMGKNVDGLRAKYAALTQQIERLRGAHASLQRVQAAQQANEAKRGEIRGKIFDAVAIGATAAAPVAQAIEFEKAMAGVAKQVAGAKDANGEYTKTYYEMGAEIQRLGREIPIATNEIADMVTAGARMGVAKEELIGFTKTAAMMASAFELPAGELADSMGKIAGMFKIPITNIGELADSINYLDDNAISKGGDIIGFMTRVGGIAASVKVTANDMAALGSTLLTLGETTETAGTAVNAMFSKFAAADKGTKNFKAAMKEIGLSTAAVQKGMQTDAMGTFQKVIAAINKLPEDKRLGVAVELVGMEHSDTLAKLITGQEELNKQLGYVRSGEAQNSMQKEFQSTLKLTSSQLTMAKNRVTELSVNLGSVLLPAVNDTLGAVGPLISRMAVWARENPKVTQAIVGTAVALTSLRLTTLVAGYAFTFLKGAALSVVSVAARVRAATALMSASMLNGAATARTAGTAMAAGFGRASLAVRGFAIASRALAFTPIGAAVSVIAGGALLIIRNWGAVKSFLVGAFEGLQTGLQPVVQTFKDFADSLNLGPAWTALVSGIQSAWNWFTQLLEPVTFSKDELGRAAAAGTSFGEKLAAAINFALTPLQWLIEGLTWVSNNMGAITGKVAEVATAAGQKIGGAWSSVKSFVGLGDDPAAPGAPAAPALPVPQMATGRGQAPSYTDSSTTTIHVTQAPGENARDLARRITQEQERDRQVRQRNLMTDGAMAQ